ncbi:MAG: glycerol-3-phosphate dehydrogenase/oxidase [Gammaproteobacteria bacterium]|jgi:glycerol-3-phosphate dehydrogenase
MARFDLVVIGAGIHGAAVARAATGCGRSVLVLEQCDAPACGTSSKSSKLIHGGLRYLESGQFRLVRECLAERRRLLATQADLVRLRPFLIPVYCDTRRGPWLIGAGLTLYALLGGKGFGRVARREWGQLDGLKTRGLKSVFHYWDAQTDDRRLTVRVMEEAATNGALIYYSTRFVAADCNRGECKIRFARDAVTETVTAGALVNAAGPWVNDVLAGIRPRIDPLGVELVQGTHIILAGQLRHGIYYLEAPQDRRAVFVMPWQDKIMIGTTETPYSGPPDRVAPLEREIEYLLETWNHYFDPALARADVIDAFAGLRVLPRGDNSPFQRSRDTVVHRAPEAANVISIYGGKLTSHHHTATRVMRLLGWRHRHNFWR